MTALDATHKLMLDGIRLSLHSITDELTDWADNAYAEHGPDADDPDPIALAVHLRILTDLARDAANARDHLAELMAGVVRRAPSLFREPLEGVGLIKVGNDYTRHEWDAERLASRVAKEAAAVDPDTGEIPTAEQAARKALRTVSDSSWLVTSLRALGIDPDPYRTTTSHTPKARIQ